jgi:hypothetical protein
MGIEGGMALNPKQPSTVGHKSYLSLAKKIAKK